LISDEGESGLLAQARAQSDLVSGSSSSGGSKRKIKLVLCGFQVFLGFHAVALHIVMILRASPFHIVNGIDDVLVNRFEILKVSYLC
jgi:hypothetical protein